MSLRSTLSITTLLLAVFLNTSAFAAEDASMHQVYLASEAGKFSEAQAMMDQVLRDHPNSAKAHFVEAELLAKQGKISSAQAELNTAEKLQPGLSFAKPESVQKLQLLIGGASHGSNSSGNITNAGNSTPWGMIMLMIGLVAFLYFAVKAMTRRNPPLAPMNIYGNNAPISPQPYGGAPSPMMNPTASGGLGSSIMSGLATGAAVGAGMVAGEALMHHFTDGGHTSDGLISDAHAGNNNYQDTNDVSQDDMGGNDFGIADNSSWDDSGVGGDDWT